jgi:hypothetical protein
VDAVGDSGEVRISSAGDDPGVSGVMVVKSVVIVAIIGQNSPAESDCAGEYVRVGDSLVRPTVFVGRKDIVSEHP